MLDGYKFTQSMISSHSQDQILIDKATLKKGQRHWYETNDLLIKSNVD